MNKTIKNSILLVLTALIWGCTIVAQRWGMVYIEPITFNGIRSLIGVPFLFPIILIMGKRRKNYPDQYNKKVLIIASILCGTVLFLAGTLQQIGLVYTTASKSGFITTLYIILVPLLGFLKGKKIPLTIWLCVILATIGLYLLSITKGEPINIGDILTLGAALGFGIHILIVDYFASRINAVKMSCIQFLVVGILSIPCMFIFETPSLTDILRCWAPLCYAGILSCGIGYTLQIIAQKEVEPIIASLILSLESVFSLFASFLFLHERLSLRELSGCAIMLLAVLLAQAPFEKLRLFKKRTPNHLT